MSGVNRMVGKKSAKSAQAGNGSGVSDARPSDSGSEAAEHMSDKVLHDCFFAQLAAPFPVDAVSWKAQSVSESKDRALAVAFVDARTVMDRLDEVVGPENWRDSYEVHSSGNVVCGLSLWLGADWVTKFDVGSRSDQSDEGDQLKAAFSDALKRAAVKWGIGRYLYSLPKQWVAYDARKKQLAETPRLPDWAIPVESPAQPNQSESTSSKPVTDTPAQNGNGHPRTGRELFRWLTDQERALVADKLAGKGDLVGHVAKAGAEAGHGSRIVNWPDDVIPFGQFQAMAFIAACKGDRPEPSAKERDSDVSR